MLFKVIKGFDAIACARRLYNAGLFYFDYPPHDLTAIHADWVFVMSQINPRNEQNPGPITPKQRQAFGFVIESVGATYGDVWVRDTPGDLFNQGTPISVKQPQKASDNAPGIRKVLVGSNAMACAATLVDSGLILKVKNAEEKSVEITSRGELNAADADQAADFDFVVKTVAQRFDGIQVTDEPPELL